MKPEKEFLEQMDALKKYMPKDMKYLFVVIKKQEDSTFDIHTKMDGNVNDISKVLFELSMINEEMKDIVLTAALNIFANRPNELEKIMKIYDLYNKQN